MKALFVTIALLATVNAKADPAPICQQQVEQAIAQEMDGNRVVVTSVAPAAEGPDYAVHYYFAADAQRTSYLADVPLNPETCAVYLNAPKPNAMGSDGLLKFAGESLRRGGD